MTLIGGQDTGLGNVDTAGQVDNGGTGGGSVNKIQSPLGSIGIANPTGPTVSEDVTFGAVAPPAVAMGRASAVGVVNTSRRSDSSTGQFLMADWAMATVRTFLYDPVNGVDTNPGFSDVAGPYNPATQARKTAAGLQAVMPRAFAGRMFRLIIASGVYATADLDQLLGGITGVGGGSLLRATATNATAGAVAFADDTADRTFVGATTATGAAAGGYNPTAGATTTVIPCQLAGGGAAGLPAEPGSPLMWRIRFDVATATAALRNVCRAVIAVTGGAQVTVDTALPAVPTVGDVFYLEMAGASFPSIRLGGMTVESTPLSTTSMQIVGVRSTGTVIVNGGWWNFTLFGGATVTIRTEQQTSKTAYTDPLAAANFTVGGGIRSEGLLGLISGTISMTMSNVYGSSIAIQTFGQSVLDGVVGTGGLTSVLEFLQAAGFGVRNPLRILGPQIKAGIEVQTYFGYADAGAMTVTITGCGAKPCIAVRRNGPQVVLTSGVTGSTGNLDVGLDLTEARGATIYLLTQPTVTGTAGDVRLADGTIITWAQAMLGVVDTSGNQIFSSNKAPTHPTFVAPGAVAVAITNAPAGSPAAPVRYVQFPDGAGGVYTVPSLT